VAAAICYGSFKLSFGDFRKPGPGFFSFFVGAVLGVLSLTAFIGTFTRGDEENSPPFWTDPKRELKVLYVIGALILYTLAMNCLGFALATLLFLIFLIRFIDPQRWWVVFSVALLATGMSVWIFKYLLDVALPTGLM
jgi:putative tricarboxylic transport membrane protein